MWYRVVATIAIVLFFLIISRADASAFDPRRDYHPITITSARAERTILGKSQVVNSSTLIFDFDLKYAIGFAVMVPITCTGCTGTVRIFAGVEDNYVEVGDVSTNFTDSCDVLINITEAYYQQLRIEVEETAGVNATFDVFVATKLGAK